MRIEYVCSQCGGEIDQIEVEVIDEAAFGFDCLSESERQDLLTFDAAKNSLTVKSLCDNCIEAMDMAGMHTVQPVKWLH